MKKFIAALAILAGATGAFANDGVKRESVGVDIHYQSTSGAGTNEAWSGELSYGRIVMPNLEIGGAYSFEGADNGLETQKAQGLNLVLRQWFGTYGRSDAIVPFVQLSGGFEFADSKYENVVGLGLGVGMFVSNQSDLRLTLKRDWGGFVDATRLDAGYYYHF